MEQTEPPPYDGAEGPDANEILHPVILVLAGRLIHSESASLPVLYELDHDVNFLSRADHKVVFSRHERRVRTSQHGSGAGGSVRTSSYQRHVFNLESPHAVTSTSRYAFFLTSVSRKALGNVGLKKTSVPRPGFKVLQINRSGEDEELFEITRKGGRYEWWDGQGKRVAIEDCVNGQMKMIITTALPRQRADG
ncbi:hypothetical protein ONZ43_g5905 [Nemania bipapillata]|uniref:Uncharacterized protein n=1 Tax=Nemania bipapillata TaxID=110536 RepID=A0ACC2I562_9PEZI|nr:hypothetical protein ONZ43_g5905 [Nemania bipapillata]